MNLRLAYLRWNNRAIFKRLNQARREVELAQEIFEYWQARYTESTDRLCKAKVKRKDTASGKGAIAFRTPKRSVPWKRSGHESP